MSRPDDGPKIACSVLSVTVEQDPAFPLSRVLVLVAGRPGTSVYLATDHELAWLAKAMHTGQGIYLHPDGLVLSQRISEMDALDVRRDIATHDQEG